MISFIGARIRSLREKKGITQEELARRMGFKDRQTISAIETGSRRITAEELLRAAKELGVSLDEITDPLAPIEKMEFSWRKSSSEETTDIGRFEEKAKRWISAFLAIASKSDHTRPIMGYRLRLNRRSSFEDASAAGERFASDFGLDKDDSKTPASELVKTMENNLGILVLMVDPLEGISGAACRCPEIDAVLINRREPPGRRNFTLAHELFHILTWETIPPKHFELAGTEPAGGRRSRVEQLADSFASAVLMPLRVLEKVKWNQLKDDELIENLKTTAQKLEVTALALKWRLVSLDILEKTRAQSIPDDSLRSVGQKEREGLPPLFSKVFMEAVSKAIDEGQLSISQTADLLGLTVEKLAELCRAHGVKALF
ncbi:ImmA/IrrE family metallo-endopeptidase [Candidatus Methylacidiphilum infernorum]|uniref:ImmA/IrrE family metallo-endopeptidase n=1 Tax=Candidatus Methylacidiphilum infernorum TaxID=511746 RepID=A0ABX7PTM6_9BACT|nr:XRE family transcriptional regulator [Candidatus Methylacidiphilum infernorum]QSR86083.1 ImmA/IrrE family metallo-endopeptidase [Candidatus Methylacidiphilum infernorum]